MLAAAAAAASPLLPAVWRGIGQAVPQLRAMLRQTRVATALVMVMSAISLEAGEVWEARRRLKKLLKTAEETADRQRKDNGGSEGLAVAARSSPKDAAVVEEQRVAAAARATSLCRHVASLRSLFLSSPGGQPEEEAVMGLLSELKVARIRAAARAALHISSARQLSASAGGGGSPLRHMSALGLPSLALRKRIASPKTSASSSEASSAERSLTAAEEASMVTDDDTSINGGSDLVIAPLPTAAATAELLVQVETRAQKYLAGFGAISRRFAAAAASSFRPQDVAAAAAVPVGIPALPPRRKLTSSRPKGGMKARRQAQAQVDEKTWKATSRLLA